MPTPLHHLSLDFTDLRLFLHIMEAGSITEGARRSHLALASASARVRGLEEAAGLPLFQRHRSGVTPTKAGLALAHHARLVLQQMQQLQHELRGHAQGVQGVVRLACNTSTITEHLPQVLAPLLTLHPGLDVDVQELPSHTTVERLLANAVDLGLVADVVDIAPLQTRLFQADRLVLVTSPKHPLARRRAGVDFTEALAHGFVALDDASALQQLLNLQAQRHGRRLHARVRLRSFDSVTALVAAGVGIAVLPQVTARRLAPLHKLRIVPLNDAWSTRRLLLCARDFSSLPPSAALLAQALQVLPPA